MSTTPDLEAAVAALSTGQLVVYPTETLYGLGARALEPAAVAAVAALKGRPAGQPIAVIASDVAMTEQVLAAPSATARRLMARFWPGPLTLVLPARPSLPPELTQAGTIGVRVSAHPVARALAAAVGQPITATSANPSGAPPPARVDEARAAFGTRVAAYVDGGTLVGGPGSTVVSVEPAAVRVVRAGAVSVDALRDALGSIPVELPERG